MEIKKPTVKKRQLDWEKMCQDEAVFLLNKGADYTAGQKDADAYANFRIIAGLLKDAPVTPYTIAMVYALKHVLSLITFAKTGKQESGEGLRGRHMDLRNYVFILNELVADHLKHFEDDWNIADMVNRVNRAMAEASRQQQQRTERELFTGRTEEQEGDKFFSKDYPYALRNVDSEFLGSDGKWHPITELDNFGKAQLPLQRRDKTKEKTAGEKLV
jgi:hypothetical protein